jgi:hypothetical protein
MHKPSECESKAHVFNLDKKRKPAEKEDSQRKLKLAKAYEAIKEFTFEGDRH